jgi:hypothetical protein
MEGWNPATRSPAAAKPKSGSALGAEGVREITLLPVRRCAISRMRTARSKAGRERRCGAVRNGGAGRSRGADICEVTFRFTEVLKLDRLFLSVLANVLHEGCAAAVSPAPALAAVVNRWRWVV